MVKLLILLVTLTSANVFASNKWSNLVEGKVFTIDRDIELEKNKETFEVSKGDMFKLVEFKALPMINVHLGEFKIENCKDMEKTSEMLLVDIKTDNKIVSVGVTLAQGCILEVYLESKDIYSQSFFY
jgi:hypothetical protein